MAKIGLLPILGAIMVLGYIYHEMRSQTAETAVVGETAVALAPIADTPVETTITPEPQGGDSFLSPSLEDVDLSAPSVLSPPPLAEATIDPEPAEATIDPEPAPNSDTLPTKTIENISFDQCLTMKARTFSQLNARPVSIVSTKVVTIDRVCVAEGSVLITCSAPDRKMVITTSPPGGGC